MILLRLAWWNLRGRRSRVALLLICVALAVAGRVGVGAVVSGVQVVAAKQARGLLGGDIELASSRPLTDAEVQAVKAALPPGAQQLSIQTLVAMVAVEGTARPVELCAVPEGYPLVGEIVASVPPATLFQGATGVAQKDLFERLGVQPGATVKLGNASLTLAGILRDEPGLTVSLFSPGPRLLISQNTLQAAGLAGFGSRIRYVTLLTIPDPREAKILAQTLNVSLGNPADSAAPPGSMGPPAQGVTLRTAEDSQAQASRFLERFADFVRLTALVALLLGGVGVASLVRGHIAETIDDVAVLRVLGATARQVLGVYLVQSALMGVAGGVLGSALGLVGAVALAALVPDWGLTIGLEWSVLAGGVALGAGTAIVFALLPLIELHAQTPLAILRRAPLPPPRLHVILLSIFLGLLLVLLAAWDSRSWVVGPLLMGTVLVATAVLLGLARLLLPLVAKIRPPQPWLRMAFVNLGRPGYRPVAAATAIGLAAFLGGTLLIYRTSLLAEFDPAKRGGLPGLFLVDLQIDQLADFRALLEEEHLTASSQLAPVVRARYRSASTVTAEPAKGTREDEQARFFRNREQNLSFRDELGPGNELTAGTWLDPHGSTIEASLEERYAQRLNVRLGDPIIFDVQGHLVTATVTSLRRVDWSTFQPNFFVYLTPSALREAPQTWIASLPTRPAAERQALTARLAERFPNVAVFDLSEIALKVMALLERLMWTIRIIAVVALAAGLVVLIGMALATAASRRHDGAVLLVLGARRRTLGSSIAAEFILLGLFAGLLGVTLAIASSWLVVGQVIGLALAVPWLGLAVLALAIAAGCAITGALACRGVWQVQPLAVLRE